MDDVVQTDENGIRSSVKPMVISQQDLESGEWSYQLIRNKEWYEMVAKPVEKIESSDRIYDRRICDCRNFTVRHSDQPVSQRAKT